MRWRSAKTGTFSFSYFLGLMTLPYWGWACGTLLGAVATGILPVVLQAALGVALYGMFIAIVIPSARDFRPVALVVVGATVLSSVLAWARGLTDCRPGWSVIICAVVVSVAAAIFFPLPRKKRRRPA